MQTEFLILRLIHVLGGIFWVGSGVFSTLFLLPALARLGPSAAGPVMGGLHQRRLFVVMPTVAVLTILSGIRLLQLTSGGFQRAYLESPMGLTLLWSGAATIVAFFLALVVARPAAVRAGAIGARMATLPQEERATHAAEMERLRRRGTVASVVAMILLIVGAAGMAIARYVG